MGGDRRKVRKKTEKRKKKERKKRREREGGRSVGFDGGGLKVEIALIDQGCFFMKERKRIGKDRKERKKERKKERR